MLEFKMKKDEKYFEEISLIEEKYYEIISHFEMNFPKPLNLQEEKKKFFSAIADDKIYNPFIKYDKKHFDQTWVNKLKKLKINTNNDIYGFKSLYKKRIKSKLSEINCHKNWGHPISTKYVKEYRGEPSFFLMLKAKWFCKRYKREKIKFKTLTPQIAAQRLSDYVYSLTGEEVNIKYEDMTSKANIIQNTLRINPYARFTSRDIKRLKVHEIGTHYLRYYNGKNSGIKILASGTSNYIETEEGLAAVVEELTGNSSNAQIFIYAGRVLATYYAQKLSFYDLFQLLKKYNFKNEDAFSLCYRAKRNLCDTSLKGGFTKDYVYFSGYFKVKKFIQKNDINDLFIGKITIDDLQVLKKYIKNHKKEIKTIFD